MSFLTKNKDIPINRQQRRALERRNRKKSNPIRDECLKKLEEILGKPTTFKDNDDDLIFSWGRENNERLEVYFLDDNSVAYDILIDSEMFGGSTKAGKIAILAKAFKSGASGIEILSLD